MSNDFPSTPGQSTEPMDDGFRPLPPGSMKTHERPAPLMVEPSVNPPRKYRGLKRSSVVMALLGISAGFSVLFLIFNSDKAVTAFKSLLAVVASLLQ